MTSTKSSLGSFVGSRGRFVWVKASGMVKVFFGLWTQRIATSILPEEAPVSSTSGYQARWSSRFSSGSRTASASPTRSRRGRSSPAGAGARAADRSDARESSSPAASRSDRSSSSSQTVICRGASQTSTALTS